MSNEYWLIKGKDKLRLPVNPVSNAYISPFGYEEVEVEGLGEITTIKKRGLREFEISSFWPREYNPSYCGYKDFIKPSAFVTKIGSWRNDREPIRYVVTGAGGINVEVTIRDFQIEPERAGNPGDIYFTIPLKEWREVKVEKVKVAKPKPKPKPRPPKPKPKPPKMYVVKKGDCLWNIAKKKSIYGDAMKWRKIYNVPANRKVIGRNPHWIYPGQKLVIPK
ncbi:MULTISPECIES: LysM peptidoglycan-binding domain-containing protein [Peribacillus]|uniref:LysM peptidoglycan-binding domain-containing protein n=1 Tax=Peribacillus TaxID=2675229 RepID=UPI001F4F0675|nr:MULTISPECIES: LysM peptidoglycan-binding domain-containing protein [unclassified Peribacillus]MCK1985164.1 LysM peptidoglycan-binding domain-containing protein [Peribacillus sp. Aquil_B1]MCK2007186.1 LysM peptidoglycan-binding domain-containing protein [Peribacillus sp. Aquil_B8]